jgi:carbonic anhydrase/acetyltransferase-like protein (isoleucine patch superfamily)
VLVERNGAVPQVDPDARIAPTATVVGDVAIAAGCYVGHGVVIESAGPPVRLETGVAVVAGTVIRSTGGDGRPAFGVHVGARTLIGPQCALAGCRLDEDCYVATAVMVFQGAQVGSGSRLGAPWHARQRREARPRRPGAMSAQKIARPISTSATITAAIAAITSSRWKAAASERSGLPTVRLVRGCRRSGRRRST